MSIMGQQKLADFFLEHKAFIMDTWFEEMLKHYPPEAARLFKREKDPFANPVGHNLRAGMEGILDWFTQKKRDKDVSPFLDKVVRIWAVQDFSPSQAVSFLVTLKEIVLKQMKKNYQNHDLLWENWHAFAQEADKLLLMAVDIYAACRERLYQIKVDEVNKRVFALLRQANMTVDTENVPALSESCHTCNSCETEKREECKNEFTSQI